VDLTTIENFLGNSKITMTPRYAHALFDAKIKTLKKLENRLRGHELDLGAGNATPVKKLTESTSIVWACSSGG
jgi:hypothetical protein